MTTEKWKSIKGLQFEYQVSDMGRVRKLCKGIEKKRYGNYRILTPRPNVDSGKLTITLQVNGVRRAYMVARLVAEAFLKKPKNALRVTTISGNECNKENVKWIVASERAVDNRAGKRYILLIDNREVGMAESLSALAISCKMDYKDIYDLYHRHVKIKGHKVIKVGGYE